MKNINENIVWVSVRFSTIFLILSIILVIICIAIPRENKDVIIVVSVLIWLALTTIVNTRDDNIYEQFWPIEAKTKEGLLKLRSKSIWITTFFSTLILLLLLSR